MRGVGRCRYFAQCPAIYSILERVMGIEPTRSAWEADILPLNYTRIYYFCRIYCITFFHLFKDLFKKQDLFSGVYRLFHIFFKFASGHHNLVPAALAFDPDIRSCPDHFPYLASARMLLFHLNQISKLKLFWLHKSTPVLL